MLRAVALLGGLLLGGIMVLFGLLVALRVLFPAWYAVPTLRSIVQMTGQKVPAASPPATPDVSGQKVPAAPLLATPYVRFESAPPTSDIVGSPAPDSAKAPPAESEADTPGTPVPETTAAALPLAENTDTIGVLLPNRRFNVLLLGSDDDLKFPSNAVLTQSMIVVSVDPTTPDVSMISIPRDFWVPIANYGYQKIDVAYEVGGIALARATVERLFGIKIDYYAWVGLNGLVQVIDTLGGVDLTVQHPILDEMYPDDLNSEDPYAFFRLYIPAGPQHLDGTTALQYVRSRHGNPISGVRRGNSRCSSRSRTARRQRWLSVKCRSS
jgi:LCP family protein required for cell wall assembly